LPLAELISNKGKCQGQKRKKDFSHDFPCPQKRKKGNEHTKINTPKKEKGNGARRQSDAPNNGKGKRIIFPFSFRKQT
jgi:hypothetical protein